MGDLPATAVKTVSEFESILDLDESWYPKWSVMKTAYLFFDRAYFVFSQKSADTVTVSCRTKNPAEDPSEKILGDFANELTNTVLREKLAEDNRSIRESIFSGVMSMGVPKRNDQPTPAVPPAQNKSIDEILKEIESELGLENLKK